MTLVTISICLATYQPQTISSGITVPRTVSGHEDAGNIPLRDYFEEFKKSVCLWSYFLTNKINPSKKTYCGALKLSRSFGNKFGFAIPYTLFIERKCIVIIIFKKLI